jgi:catechol 2,3-dioxygenase-like lactoylglutathione lyase family enzyme
MAMVVSGLALDHVQIAMPAGGESKARAFFGGLLGLTEIPKPSAQAARGGCWFAIGQLQLHLGIETNFRPARKAHVALRSNDLSGLHQRLLAAGHDVQNDTPVDGHARFFTADPFGNRIEFIAA